MPTLYGFKFSKKYSDILSISIQFCEKTILIRYLREDLNIRIQRIMQNNSLKFHIKNPIVEFFEKKVFILPSLNRMKIFMLVWENEEYIP